MVTHIGGHRVLGASRPASCLSLPPQSCKRPSLRENWSQGPRIRVQSRQDARVTLKLRAKPSSAGEPADAGPDADGVASSNDTSHATTWNRGRALLERTASLVWANAWSILALFALSDSAVFIVHRLCHRLTNEVALRFLLPSELANSDAIGVSLWWLSNNPEVANFQTGYQWIVGLVFLLMFPIGILLRTSATASAQLILASDLEKSGHPGWRPPIKKIKEQLQEHLPGVRGVISRLWQVDLLVAVRAIPLQGLSLLLVPIPWTLPRLLNLQLALPVALFEGEHGDEALKVSAQRSEPVRRFLAVPYVGLLLAPKLLAFFGRLFLTSLSPRIARDVPEIPIVAYVSLALATLILNRIQDLLPLVAYVEANKAQGRQQQLAVAA